MPIRAAAKNATQANPFPAHTGGLLPLEVGPPLVWGCGLWVGGCAAGGGGGGCGGLSARSLGGGGGACGLGVSGGGRYAGHGGCWRSWWCGVCRVLGQSWLRLVLPCLCAGRSGWRPGGPASCGWLVGLGRSRRAGGSLPCRRAWGPDGLAASGRGPASGPSRGTGAPVSAAQGGAVCGRPLPGLAVPHLSVVHVWAHPVRSARRTHKRAAPRVHQPGRAGPAKPRPVTRPPLHLPRQPQKRERQHPREPPTANPDDRPHRPRDPTLRETPTPDQEPAPHPTTHTPTPQTRSGTAHHHPKPPHPHPPSP